MRRSFTKTKYGGVSHYITTIFYPIVLRVICQHPHLLSSGYLQVVTSVLYQTVASACFNVVGQFEPPSASVLLKLTTFYSIT